MARPRKNPPKPKQVFTPVSLEDALEHEFKKSFVQAIETVDKKKNVFDFINNISTNKSPTFCETEEDAKEYVPFIANKHFSFFPDTIMLANLMNARPSVPKRWNYLFYLNTVRKGFRKSGKWFKEKKNYTLEAISTYFNCNMKTAAEYLKHLPKEEIERIEKIVLKDDKGD